jgi:DNA ligase (NAD+)
MTFFEYATLVDVLNEWTKEYALGNPSVEDSVYDSKYKELKAFEINNPTLIIDTSPTRTVVDGAVGFKKVKHEIPMVSIANANGIDESVSWVNGINTKFNINEYVIEFKMDGLGLALIYNDGILVDAITRGQDNIGDSVWENVLQIENIPKTIPIKGIHEIRGEVVWFIDNYELYNDYLIDNNKKPMSNPRNGAAGILKSHDTNVVKNAKLSFVAYSYVRGTECIRQSDDLETLIKFGFYVQEYHIVNIDNFKEIAEHMRLQRYNLPFAIDGIVIKVNEKQFYKTIGGTTKSPNYYRAYKFPPEEKQTHLLNIEHSIGMSGAITPVAIFEEIQLAGTKVKRCSLHNWDIVDYLGLHKDCNIIIRKAGEIIPEIVQCIETKRKKDDYEVLKKENKNITPYWNNYNDAYYRPTVCPFCGNILKNQTNASGDKLISWVCDNADCQVQIFGKFVNFASRSCMNITGVGEALVQNLLDAGKLKSVADFYKLTVNDLIGLGNIREKSANKIINSIQKSKNNYLHQLIEGLSIPSVGHSVSPLIANSIKKLNATFTINDLIECGITENVANIFYNWINNNTELVNELVNMNIACNIATIEKTSNKLDGYVAIMTGTFNELDREVFKKLVIENGGTVCSSITKKTNLVLLGDNAGPKKITTINILVKSGYNIKIITPNELNTFFNLIK